MIARFLTERDAVKATATNQISLRYLRECLQYDPMTGVLTWLERPSEHFPSNRASAAWNARFAGRPAGTLNAHGYWQVNLGHRRYGNHRLAYALHLGIEPSDLPDEIDHRDCDPANNRFSNLRAATKADNCCNRGPQRNNTSGFKGVSSVKGSGRWQAFINRNGKKHHLGYFATPEEAHAAYCEAAPMFHGQFARVS